MFVPRASCRLAYVWRSEWKPAHGAPTSSTTGFRTRAGRALLPLTASRGPLPVPACAVAPVECVRVLAALLAARAVDHDVLPERTVTVTPPVHVRRARLDQRPRIPPPG